MQLSRQSEYLFHSFWTQDISSNVSLGKPATTAIRRESVTRDIRDTYIDAAIFELLTSKGKYFKSVNISNKGMSKSVKI